MLGSRAMVFTEWMLRGGLNEMLPALGLGNVCAEHGDGRKMGRGQVMRGTAWLSRKAEGTAVRNSHEYSAH